MPVSTESSISGPYFPNGATTDFAFNFKAIDGSEIVALDQDGVVIPSALYEVSLDDDEGGSIAFSVAPTTADYSSIYIAGDPALTQPSDFSNAGPSFNPAGVTRAFDRAAIRDLKQQREIDRSLKVPFGEQGQSILPSASNRSNKLLGFDSLGALFLYSGTALASLIAPFLPSNLKGDPGSPGEGYATRGALALAGNVATARDDAFLTEPGREGKFVFDDSDLSSEVSDDNLQGLYIPTLADPTGASGAWVRQWRGPAFCEWFGGVADYVALAGTDNAPAINACLDLCGNCCLLDGNYGVGSKINIGQEEHLWTAGAVASSVLLPLAGYSDTAVVDMSATRSFATRIQIFISTTLFNPATYAGTGSYIDGFVTTGDFYHQHLQDCRVSNGRRAFWPRAKEMKLHRCNADGSYDGYYIGGFDTSIFNCTATDVENNGLYSNCGIEVNDLHIIRAKNISFSLFNQSPVMVNNLFIDTPNKIGIQCESITSAMFNGVYFTKAAEYRKFDGGTNTGSGTTPDWDFYYFKLINTVGCTFQGGTINIQNSAANISQDAIYFLEIADSANDSLRSRGNEFAGFQGQSITVARDATRRGYAAWQKWINCRGLLGRFNNEGLIYRSDEETISAGGSVSAKVYIPRIEDTNFSRMSVLRGEYVAAQNGTPANFTTGEIAIRITAAGFNGTVTPKETGGTPPVITINTIAYNTSTQVLTFNINHAGSGSVALAFTLRAPLDNQGYV